MVAMGNSLVAQTDLEFPWFIQLFVGEEGGLGTSVVAQQVEWLPRTFSSTQVPGPSPSCSASNPASCQSTEEATEDGLGSQVSVTYVGE